MLIKVSTWDIFVFKRNFTMESLHRFEKIAASIRLDIDTSLDEEIYKSFYSMLDDTPSYLKAVAEDHVKNRIDHHFVNFHKHYKIDWKRPLEPDCDDDVTVYKIIEIVLLTLSSGNINIVEHLLEKEREAIDRGQSLAQVLRAHHGTYKLMPNIKYNWNYEKHRYVWNNRAYPNAFALYKTLLPHDRDDILHSIVYTVNNSHQASGKTSQFNLSDAYLGMFASMIGSTELPFFDGDEKAFSHKISEMLMFHNNSGFVDMNTLVASYGNDDLNIVKMQEYFADNISLQESFKIYGRSPNLHNLFSLVRLFDVDEAEKAIVQYGIRDVLPASPSHIALMHVMNALPTRDEIVSWYKDARKRDGDISYVYSRFVDTIKSRMVPRDSALMR